jgi:hypothetical protein
MTLGFSKAQKSAISEGAALTESGEESGSVMANVLADSAGVQKGIFKT